MATAPRQPHFRAPAMVLAVQLAAIGLVVAPSNTAEAQAADACSPPLNCSYDIGEIVSVKPVDTWWTDRRKDGANSAYYEDGYGNGRLHLEASPGQAANGDPANKSVQNNDAGRIQTRDAGDGSQVPNREKWQFATNSDGTFRIVNKDSGQCMDATVDHAWSRVAQAGCNYGSSQNWYIQPAGSAYVIRHVDDDRCIDMVNGHTSPGTEVQIAPCSKDWDPASDAQKWRLPGADGKVLGQLATDYALKQVNAKSPVISARYHAASEEKATLGKIERVSYPVKNDTSTAMKRSVNWSQTSQYTYTNGGSVTTGVSVELGGKDSFVHARFSTEVTGTWGNAWMNNTTTADNQEITIQPGKSGWFARAQLMKTVTGSWVLTTDRDTEWWGDGTATLPAREGTDDQTSRLTACETGSTDPACVATDPGKV
ncbi:RICIN domain-containing protein [Streptomyces hygroscopicus]|uniref:RICIN domain-containing protein n=1 Tax=Streptomyces hygroscopicus TaxID=1912 RepID=UPI001FCA9670|nr:RICIN domain-containing protein [Streptomyces hygroscopicus]BDH12686.1 hypothetical protein HOK021_38650 [Streptomyces hygroscopicus]